MILNKWIEEKEERNTDASNSSWVMYFSGQGSEIRSETLSSKETVLFQSESGEIESGIYMQNHSPLRRMRSQALSGGMFSQV